MKSKLILIIFGIFLISLFSLNVEAKSGCCSRHGGVCGDSCCDGSALSVACGGGSLTQTAESPSIIICTEKYLNDSYCKDKTVYQLYQRKDCSSYESYIKSCGYKEICKDGECIPEPKDYFLWYFLGFFIILSIIIYYKSKK